MEKDIRRMERWVKKAQARYERAVRQGKAPGVIALYKTCAKEAHYLLELVKGLP